MRCGRLNLMAIAPREGMAEKNFDQLASELREQREAIFQRIADTEGEVELIKALRDTELEERAQEDRLVRLLSRLDDRARFEIEAIDGALQRLREGRYGVCLSCGEPIPVARLRILPTTELCRDCSEERERNLRRGPIEEPPAARAGNPRRDDATLSAAERGQALRELVRADGRIDVEDLRVVVRHGTVYLRGSLPSEAEHQILLGLVRDVAGFEEVDDHLEIQGLSWQRDEAGESETVAPGPLAGFVESREEDVAPSERGVDWEPPAAPTPEEEPEDMT